MPLTATSFRGKLKQMFKNAGKQEVEKRDRIIISFLSQFGLYANYDELRISLKQKKATSRNFTRLGKAARKNRTYISLLEIANNAEKSMDLRKIPFLGTNQIAMSIGAKALKEDGQKCPVE